MTDTMTLVVGTACLIGMATGVFACGYWIAAWVEARRSRKGKMERAPSNADFADALVTARKWSQAERDEINLRIRRVCETTTGHDWLYEGGAWNGGDEKGGQHGFICRHCGQRKAVLFEDLTAEQVKRVMTKMR